LLHRLAAATWVLAIRALVIVMATAAMAAKPIPGFRRLTAAVAATHAARRSTLAQRATRVPAGSTVSVGGSTVTRTARMAVSSSPRPTRTTAAPAEISAHSRTPPQAASAVSASWPRATADSQTATTTSPNGCESNVATDAAHCGNLCQKLFGAPIHNRLLFRGMRAAFV